MQNVAWFPKATTRQACSDESQVNDSYSKQTQIKINKMNKQMLQKKTLTLSASSNTTNQPGLNETGLHASWQGTLKRERFHSDNAERNRNGNLKSGCARTTGIEGKQKLGIIRDGC